MKRSNDIPNTPGSSIKKLRYDGDDFDDLWGSDPDIADIDDCLLRATQVAENQLNIVGAPSNQNTSIIPSSYTAFKKNDVFSSTAVNFEGSFRESQALRDGRVQKLQADLLAKEGEVTILRSQLKHTKATLEAESRKFQEFEDKLNASKKEMSFVSTELEFKKLEIANLKRKLLDVTKATNQDINLNGSQIVKENIALCQEAKPKPNLILQPIVSDVCPLKSSISPLIFNVGPNREVSYELGRIKEENLLSQKTVQRANPKQTKLSDDVPMRLEYIFPEISTLMGLNRSELNQESTEKIYNKVLLVSMQFLYNLCEYLMEFERSLMSETIRQSDLEYLLEKNGFCFDSEVSLFDAKQIFSDECGIQCRQSVAIVAALLHHSQYVRNFLTGGGTLSLRKEENDFLTNFTCLSIDEGRHFSNDCQYLNVILTIAEILGRTRKSFNYTGLLCAVSALLSGICRHAPDLSAVPHCYVLIVDIMNEIIFARPCLLLLHYFADFLKNASLHKNFVQVLCRMPQKSSLKRNSKKGIILINKDCCPFQVFSLLYKDSLDREFGNDERSCERNFNVLQFLSNAFASNSPWLYYCEGKHYDCLFECNELSIEIIYASLVMFERNYASGANQKYLLDILRMSVRILYTLNFKSYEFIERNIRIYSQYKVIIKKLLDLKDLINFRQKDIDFLVKLGSSGIDEGPFSGAQSLNSHLIWTK